MMAPAESDSRGLRPGIASPIPRRPQSKSTFGPGDILFGVLFTLGCGDLLSLPLAGGNFRVFYVACIVFLALNAIRIRIDGDIAIRTLILLACLVPSVLSSIDLSRSLLYILWTILSVACTFGVFPRLASVREVSGTLATRRGLHDLLIWLYRIQLVIALLLYGSGIHERPQFLYYEPSYFSISLALYCALVAFKWREQRPVIVDLVLALVYLITSASGAFVLVLAITVVLNLPAFRPRMVIAVSAGALLLMGAYVVFVDDVNTILIRMVLSQEVDPYELLLRGGNRLSRILTARDIFLDHPFKGVGYGAFETATRSADLNDYSENQEWLSSEGKPAINIYLEILATAGVIGLMGFAIFFSKLFRWIFGAGKASPFSKAAICMLVLLTWESNFLRPYLWILLSLCWLEMKIAQPGRFRRSRNSAMTT